MWSKVISLSNHSKTHQSLREDEGFLFFTYEKARYISTSRYLKSIFWLNATTSELCLLFTNLRALHTTGVGWEGGSYAGAYFRITRSGWEILAITHQLTSTLPFTGPHSSATRVNSLPVVILYLIYPLSAPLPPASPTTPHIVLSRRSNLNQEALIIWSLQRIYVLLSM